MSTFPENETWIIDLGDAVIGKMADRGIDGLSPVERLVYCLWVADYGMRNAGDLDTARDLHPNFLREAVHLSGELSLAFTRESFSLPMKAFQCQYFDRFEQICDEIRNA